MAAALPPLMVALSPGLPMKDSVPVPVSLTMVLLPPNTVALPDALTVSLVPPMTVLLPVRKYEPELPSNSSVPPGPPA